MDRLYRGGKITRPSGADAAVGGEGASCYVSARKKRPRELSEFVHKRGILLIYRNKIIIVGGRLKDAAPDLTRAPDNASRR